MAKVGPRIAATVIFLVFEVAVAKGRLAWIPDWLLIVAAGTACVYWLSYSSEVREIANSAFVVRSSLLHPSGGPIAAPRIHVLKTTAFIVTVLLVFPALGWLAIHLRPRPSPKTSVALLSAEWHSSGHAIVFPSDGVVYGIQLWELPAYQNDGLTESLGAPGTEVGWAGEVQKYSITNYAQATLFNVSMSLHITFKEAIRGSNAGSLRTGNTTFSREWPISIPKIDPGPDRAFVFYVANISYRWACISLPESVQGETAAEGKRTFELVTPEHMKAVGCLLPTRRPVVP
jgi:hypothetical protein